MIMKNENNKKLLLPKTALGIISVVDFVFVWWLLNSWPVLHIFNDMVKEEPIVWLLGMPIDFTYIIGVALFTSIFSIYILSKWTVGDKDD